MEIGMLNFWLGLLATALMEENHFSTKNLWRQFLQIAACWGNLELPTFCDTLPSNHSNDLRIDDDVSYRLVHNLVGKHLG